MTKHTVGPWQRFDNGGDLGSSGASYGPHYADCVWGPGGPGHGLIADCSPNGQPPTPETIANAKLVAAAPLMLEALRGAREFLGGLWYEIHGAETACGMLDVAIAAATGEQQS